MRTFQELLELSQDCYRRARAALDPFESWVLTREGNEYLRQAKETRRGAHVIQAAFPNSRLFEL